MKKLSIIITLISITTMLVIIPAITITAQTSLIPFQARLVDGANQPFEENKVYRVVFKIYNAATGGKSLWDESHPSVSVIGGQINVLLGSLVPLTFDFKAPKYLGITIDGTPEMVPRHQLVPSFHAQSASLAHNAEKLGGKEPGWYASKEHVAQAVADVTADIEALAGSLVPTVAAHTTHIQDMSSDVNINKIGIEDINNRIKTSIINLYKQTNSYCVAQSNPQGFYSTCKTKSYGSWKIYEKVYTCYYHCNGNAPTCNIGACSNSGVCKMSPDICNNSLIGKILVE